MKQRLVLGLVVLFLLTGMALGVTYPQYTDVTITQTGGPFVTAGSPGYNNWDTPLQSTNTGTSTEEIWFVWTEAWQDNTGTLENMTWDNSLSQFEYTDTSSTLYTASAANAAFNLSLDPSVTNIPIPSGFGLSTSDSVPAFLVGTLAPGATVNWDVDQTLSSNISAFYFSGSFVAQPAPEPGSMLLLGSGLACMAGALRRKLRK